MNERIALALLPAHFDYIMNVLGTANLRYVDVAPIVQDIAQQRQQAQQGPQEAAGASKPNGAAHAPATQEPLQ